MSTLKPNRFSSYELSPEELIYGTILTTLQKQCIQNQICQLAETKLMLKYDPSDSLKFLQQEAELQGQIMALEYLITLSENMEEQTKTASLTM